MVHKVPTCVRGVTYPSQAAAAKALGVAPSALHGATERGTLDNVGLGRARHNLVPLMIGDVIYPSARAASEATGVNVKTLRKYAAKARGRGSNWFHHPRTGIVKLVDHG